MHTKTPIIRVNVYGQLECQRGEQGYSFSSKSLAFTTTHTLTFVPHFLNEDHSFMTMGRFQLVSGTSSDQKTEVAGLPNGVEAPSAGGYRPPGMSKEL